MRAPGLPQVWWHFSKRQMRQNQPPTIITSAWRDCQLARWESHLCAHCGLSFLFFKKNCFKVNLFFLVVIWSQKSTQSRSILRKCMKPREVPIGGHSTGFLEWSWTRFWLLTCTSLHKVEQNMEQTSFQFAKRKHPEYFMTSDLNSEQPQLEHCSWM